MAAVSDQIHLSDNIKAFEEMREELETDHFGYWAVVYEKELVGAYPDLDSAADAAVEKCVDGPYLIRQIGVPPPSLSASMMTRATG